MAQIHILVVDDNEPLRGLLQKFLHRSGFLVSTARDAAHARRILAGLDFDILIIDVMMPGENGIALTRMIRQNSAVPIMLLTAKGETQSRIEGLEAGADDYMSKPFEPKELLLRINAILRRTPQKTQETQLILGELCYDLARGELWEGAAHIHLTSSESALMRLLAAHVGQVLTRAQLISAIGGEAGSESRAIDVLVTRLRRKIETTPKEPRYLQTIRGEGYMLQTGAGDFTSAHKAVYD